MTPLDNRIDEDFVARYYRGEAIVLEGQLEDVDGAVEQLDGLTFFAVIMMPDGDELRRMPAAILRDTSGPYFQAVFDGEVTTDLYGQSALRWALGQYVAGRGNQVIVEGPLILRPGPVARPVDGETGAAAIAHRFVRRLTTTGRSTVRISNMGPRGLSPWEAEGKTREQYQADLTKLATDAGTDIALEQVGAAITELGETTSQKIAEVDDAIAASATDRAATVKATGDAKLATKGAQDAVGQIGSIGEALAGSREAQRGSENARDQAVAYSPSTFETTDPTPRMYLADPAGRIVLELPDPRVAALFASMAQLNGSSLFETTDAVAKAYVLDAGGRVVQQFPDPNVAPLLATAATGNVFETTDLSVAAIVLDASGRVAALVPSQAAVAAATPTTVQEVVTARGNMPTLDARLAGILTPDAAPIVDRYGRSFLRRTHYLLMKRALPFPESAQINILAPGDSYTNNASRWVGPTMDVLAARYGDGGGGWCGFGGLASGNVAPWTLSNQPNYTGGNVRPSAYPTRLFGNVVQTYFTAASPDLAMATLTQSGDQCFQAFPAAPVHNGCDLFFFGTGDGVIRYSWGTYKGSGSAADPANYNFAAATSLNVQGTVDTTQIADIKVGMPAGQGALLIEWVAGTVKLFGVNLKSAAPGVRIHKLAATGSSISQWSNAPAMQWEVGIAALGGQLVVYMDGTNSQTGGMAPATWGTHLANVVARFRSALPAIDLLIATPPENQRTTNTVPMPAYAVEGRKRARAGRFAFLDTQTAFGDPANPTEYGSAGAVPLYSPDLIHPDPQTGGRLLAAEIIDFIVPY